MNRVTIFQQISALPIPTTLQEQTLFIPTEPFNDEAETEQVWDELQCELWYLNLISDLTADDVEGTGIERLELALIYTEF